MKTILTLALMLATTAAFAATTKTYQVTGPVLEATDTKLVVQKGTEKWELNRDANTKVEGTIEKGAKVTVQYTMTAATVEVKADKKTDAKKKK